MRRVGSASQLESCQVVWSLCASYDRREPDRGGAPLRYPNPASIDNGGGCLRVRERPYPGRGGTGVRC